MSASFQKVHNCRLSRHTGGEGKASFPSFQLSDSILQNLPRWIRRTGVVPPLCLPHILKHECRCLVDGHRNGTGCRIRPIPGVDGYSFKSHVPPPWLNVAPIIIFSHNASLGEVIPGAFSRVFKRSSILTCSPNTNLTASATWSGELPCSTPVSGFLHSSILAILGIFTEVINRRKTEGYLSSRCA